MSVISKSSMITIKEYRSIKEIFDELVVLLGDLSEEEKRARRENLEEDELTVFDMLVANKKISG